MKRGGSRASVAAKIGFVILTVLVFLTVSACTLVAKSDEKETDEGLSAYLVERAEERPLSPDRPTFVAGDTAAHIRVPLPPLNDRKVTPFVEVVPSESLEQTRVLLDFGEQGDFLSIEVASPEVGESVALRFLAGFPVTENEELEQEITFELVCVAPVRVEYSVSGAGATLVDAKVPVDLIRKDAVVSEVQYWYLPEGEAIVKLRFSGKVNHESIEARLRKRLQGENANSGAIKFLKWTSDTEVVVVSEVPGGDTLLDLGGVRDTRGVPLAENGGLWLAAPYDYQLWSWDGSRLPQEKGSIRLPGEPRMLDDGTTCPGYLLLGAGQVAADEGRNPESLWLWKGHRPELINGLWRINSAQWLPDCQHIMVALQNRVLLVDSETGEVRKLLSGETVTGTAVSPEGRIAILTLTSRDAQGDTLATPLLNLLIYDTEGLAREWRGFSPQGLLDHVYAPESAPIWVDDHVLFADHVPGPDNDTAEHHLSSIEVRSGEVKTMMQGQPRRIGLHWLLVSQSNDEGRYAWNPITGQRVHVPQTDELGIEGAELLAIGKEALILSYWTEPGTELVAWDRDGEVAVPLGHGTFLGWRDGMAVWVKSPPR